MKKNPAPGGIEHPASGIQHPTTSIEHPTTGIEHPESSNQHPSFLVAVQTDDYGPGDSAAPRWKKLLREAGHRVREVDVFRADILEQLRGCDGFMWRFAQFPDMVRIARRLLPVIERELGLAVYPDQNTCWHYDDKIAQSFLFKALEIPTPRTWVWFDRDLALDWARGADYPMVMKLSSGAGSNNVVLVRSFGEACGYIDRLFGEGVRSFRPSKHTSGRERLKNLPSMALKEFSAFIRYFLRGVVPPPRQDPRPAGPYWQVEKNYAYFQEYLPGNDFDTRVTVIGNRAFAYRRFNRPGDFRASGSGIADWNPEVIDPRFISLAFETAEKLRAQSCAIDGLWRDGVPVVGEVSYTYVLWMVEKCPGHWDREMVRHTGHMSAEEAHVADFLDRLKTRSKVSASKK